MSKSKFSGHMFAEMYIKDPNKTIKILIDAYNEETERIRNSDAKKQVRDDFDEIIKDILPESEPLLSIARAAMKGEEDETLALVQTALDQKFPALDIVTKGLVPGIQAAAMLYDNQWFYAPDLLMAGSAVEKATPVAMARVESIEKKGLILMHAPAGDVHDIGKNIVKVVLESSFFDIIDLGIDVSTEKVVASAKELKPVLIIGSALMTTTMGGFSVTGKALVDAGIEIPLAIGGAPLTKKWTEDNVPQGIYGVGPKDAVAIAEMAAKGLSWNEIREKAHGNG